MHCAFSTKDRRPLIKPDMQPRLWQFMGGIARQNGATALAIGGVEDHVHLLLSLSADCSIAHVLQEVKAGSSKFIHENFEMDFGWQRGYGAFSIGPSQREHTIEYIAHQPEHHKKRSFEEEFDELCRLYGIEVQTPA
jgi:REP element-mobilizing transposase RayT